MKQSCAHRTALSQFGGWEESEGGEALDGCNGGAIVGGSKGDRSGHAGGTPWRSLLVFLLGV